VDRISLLNPVRPGPLVAQKIRVRSMPSNLAEPASGLGVLAPKDQVRLVVFRAGDHPGVDAEHRTALTPILRRR